MKRYEEMYERWAKWQRGKAEYPKFGAFLFNGSGLFADAINPDMDISMHIPSKEADKILKWLNNPVERVKINGEEVKEYREYLLLEKSPVTEDVVITVVCWDEYDIVHYDIGELKKWLEGMMEEV